MATVLVVEDDAAIRALLSLTLDAEGYTVWTAGDGADGLATALQAKPDVILLDMALPRMEGAEVVEKLRADPSTRDVRIVCMSAMYGLVSTMALPVQGYLPKPFDPEVLLTILAEVLHQGAAVAAR
jgi:CheY-like chemotaxis protein